MTLESTRRQVLQAALVGLAGTCVTGLGHPPTAALSHKQSRRHYQDRYRELFKACGTDLDQKALVGRQMLANYDRDARLYHLPDRAAVVRMQAALQRQHHARLIAVSS
ncbi:hypothetical protein [Actinomadura gamaensis]|uniref:Uncharacterized protein n=1 Tax=Actinomadura gamaensis TaxID=1763541 RepID=A0ABV9U802_9ACTN